MRSRVLVLLLGVVASLAIVSPARAATFGVSLTVGAARADVGQTIRLSGTVSGPKAAGRRVVVQRQVGTGAWANVGTTTTSSRKTYSFAHRVSAVGAQRFRAVVPKHKTTQQGVSSPRGFTGWTWLWLADQNNTVSGNLYVGGTERVLGINRPNSISLLGGTNGAKIRWELGRSCDRGVVEIGATGESSPFNIRVTTRSGDAIRYETTTSEASIDRDTTASFGSLITADTNWFDVVLPGGSDSAYGVVMSPRVHCSVSRLVPVSARTDF